MPAKVKADLGLCGSGGAAQKPKRSLQCVTGAVCFKTRDTHCVREICAATLSVKLLHVKCCLGPVAGPSEGAKKT
jgi:hypothetical protein